MGKRIVTVVIWWLLEIIKIDHHWKMRSLTNPTILKLSFLQKTGKLSEGQFFHINKRSVDARQRKIKVILQVEIDEKPLKVEYVEYTKRSYDVRNSDPVIIVGAGPAGLFAALKAIEGGLKPIIFERGKDVQSRRQALAAINKDHVVNPESNYCFGEGGAGTYSDGNSIPGQKKGETHARVFDE